MSARYYKRRTPELRNKFNDIAEDYDACRFSYPAELYSFPKCDMMQTFLKKEWR